MSKKLLVVAAFVAVLLGASANAAEKKVKMQDLPPAVQKTVQEQSKGATLRGLGKEVDNGKTVYEAELTVNGHSKDITIDSDGKIVTVEEQVAIDSVPAAARAAIEKSAGKRKIVMVELVTEGRQKFYEAHIKSGLKKSEVKVDANGKPVK